MVLQAIAELIAARNGCPAEDIQPETTFASLGVDSLETVEMVMQLEDKLGFEIELTEKMTTVGDLVAFVEALQRENGK